jgi:hypothetical protein
MSNESEQILSDAKKDGNLEGTRASQRVMAGSTWRQMKYMLGKAGESVERDHYYNFPREQLPEPGPTKNDSRIINQNLNQIFKGSNDFAFEKTLYQNKDGDRPYRRIVHLCAERDQNNNILRVSNFAY